MSPPECDCCERDVPAGEVVSLDGGVYCRACGWRLASGVLEHALMPAYEGENLRTREHQEALAVVDALRAHVVRRVA